MNEPTSSAEKPVAAFDQWSVVHSIALVAAVMLSTWTRILSLLGVAALISFSWLIVSRRGTWTPTGTYGWANVVTTLRMLLVCVVALVFLDAPGRLLTTLFLVSLALDGVDGWLARRTGTASAFGAHFDMEADALFVLIACQALWLRQQLGHWILVPGLLRYLYVLWKALLPKGTAAASRSRLGATAFVLLASGLSLAFMLPSREALFVALPGTVSVCLSFGYSFRWTWANAMKS